MPTKATGKWQPLDAEPSEQGNIELVHSNALDQLVAIVRKPGEATPGASLYMPHHATCPDVAKYRKNARA